MEMLNTMVFNILVALTVALVGIVTRQLLPYLREKRIEATEKIRQTQWSWCADIIDAVVRAIEQTVSDEIHGDDKKAEAILLIGHIFYQAGLHMSDEQIDALIEAAVQSMNANNMEVYENDATGMG